jgi:hypothetical protein
MRAFIFGVIILLAACASPRGEQGASTISDPVVITFQNMYWGNETSRWLVPRDGEGRYADQQRTVTFHVSAETFDRVRELLRPYEGHAFVCQRAIADGPYGHIIWTSREGREDHRAQWDAGCVTGDADDMFTRLDAVMDLLGPLRDAGEARPALEPDASPR